MKHVFFVVILLSLVPSLHSQDLNRLRERSSGLWAERVNRDRAKASLYVLPANRSAFPMQDGVREAKVVSFEFLENSRVLVTSQVKMDLPPPFNNLSKNIAETWEWTNGSWFLRVVASETTSNPKSVPNLFGKSVSGVAGTLPPLKFELVEDEVRLGQHKQGDLITGTVHFQAPRSQVSVIRGRGIPGLSIKQVLWETPDGGAINFVLDTSLLSASTDATVVFDAVGKAVGTILPTSGDTVALKVDIVGQVRIQQTPSKIDPTKAGRAEISIQNVGDKAFSVKGIHSSNRALSVDGDIPPSIQPGQILKLQIEYSSSSEPVDGQLYLSFSPGVLPGDSLVFPLSFVEPEPVAPGVLREQLEEIVRQQRGR